MFKMISNLATPWIYKRDCMNYTTCSSCDLSNIQKNEKRKHTQRVKGGLHDKENN